MTASLYIALLAAAEGGASAVPEWIPKAFNLALVLGLIYFLVRKPMANFFATRSAAILAELDRAKRDRDLAQSRLAEVETRLSRLAAEQAEIRAEAEREAEAEHARIAARAEEEAQKVAETAEREIAGALKVARADLQRFAAEKAAELAEGMIRAEMTDEDRKRMVEQYAAELGEVKK
jgi:F-type H+-transporting ATPase subunit b